MRLLSHISRRRFSQGMGVTLALTLPPVRAMSHGGTHVLKVQIKRFKFEPNELEIRVGDKVQWTNEDSAPHTATALDGTWDTGEITKGQTQEITFDQPGDYAYFCAFHRHMTGRIVVVARG